MLKLIDAEPGPPFEVRAPCCGRGNAGKSEILLLPPQARSFFNRLKARNKNIFETLRINPDTDRICTGCLSKLWGRWDEHGGRVATRAQVMALVWHGPLPVEVEAKAEMWEDRVGRRGEPQIPDAAAALQEGPG